jgi:hypothetical protein
MFDLDFQQAIRVVRNPKKGKYSPQYGPSSGKSRDRHLLTAQKRGHLPRDNQGER